MTFKLPSRDALTRFFRDRPDCTLAEAGEVIGAEVEWVASHVADAAAPLVPWDEVALLFLRVWPPTTQEAMLHDIGGLPELYRLKRVEWRLPEYLVIALEKSSAREREERDDAQDLTLEQWLSEQLLMLVSPDIYDELMADPVMREAYLFPAGGREEEEPMSNPKERAGLQPDHAEPPEPKVSDEEALSRAELCVRVLESFFEAVDEQPETRRLYTDLYARYMAVLQRELEPFAFDLAIALFSRSAVVRAQRRETDES